MPVLAFRISYVGEQGWELHFKYEDGLALWDALHALGVIPVGVETCANSRRMKISLRLQFADAHRFFRTTWLPEAGHLQADAVLWPLRSLSGVAVRDCSCHTRRYPACLAGHTGRRAMEPGASRASAADHAAIRLADHHRR